MTKPRRDVPILSSDNEGQDRSSSIESGLGSKTERKSLYGDDDDQRISDIPQESKDATLPIAPALAAETADRAESALGQAILRLLGLRKSTPTVDLDSIATKPSIWDGEDVDALKEKYIRPDWENIEAFDPNFRWTYREEKQVKRAIDMKIMIWVCIMFSAVNIDRGNISNANSDGILTDLGLTTADYNLGNTLAKLGFLIAELPSQLISKRLGPDRWIPLQICIFSIISASQFWLKGRSTFFATRFLIALFQGGFIPDTILYLSYFYNGRALPIRLAWYWMSSNINDIVSGFLAVGFLKLRGYRGYAGWQWLFLFEGIITLSIGIASFFMMPTAPTKTKTWFRPKGYFTDRQVKIIVNSAIRDDPGKGGMHNRQPLTIKMIIKCLGDYDMYPMYLLGLLFGIPKYPVTNYLTLSFKQLGFSTVQTNLLSIPYSVTGMFTQFSITAISELVNNRSFVAAAEDIWLLPCFIALVCLKSPVNPWSYFALETVLLSYPYTHAMQVAWTSRNSGTVEMRTISASAYNMFVQASAMIGANVYQASDAPRYTKANKGLIGLLCFNVFLLYPGTYFYYRFRNSQKAKVWDALTQEEKAEYLRNTTDKGNKRLDFRFAT